MTGEIIILPVLLKRALTLRMSFADKGNECTTPSEN